MNLFIFFFFKVLHLAKTGKETCLHFVLYETRQALTARFYLRFFVLDMKGKGEGRRAFLLQHYPLPQAAVRQCFDSPNENANFT